MNKKRIQNESFVFGFEEGKSIRKVASKQLYMEMCAAPERGCVVGRSSLFNMQYVR